MKLSELEDWCIVCGFRGAILFEDGWFHVSDEERTWRHCRQDYLQAKTEIELRRTTSFDSMESVGYGWRGILTILVLALLKTDPEFQIYQIKEKFGGLRFYVGGMSIVGHGLIEWAETRSGHICEACGRWGELREGGWWKTLCDDCQARRETGEQPWITEESALS